jgi:hypothetical protein
MHNVYMAESESFRFANAVRTLGTVARENGYIVPSFKSPPNSNEHTRTFRKNKDGSVTISIIFRGRAWLSTLSDMIEGFVVANNPPDNAQELRDLLWSTIEMGNLLRNQNSISIPLSQSLRPAA